VFITDESISGWLPGEKELTVTYEIPEDIETGSYDLQMGIVFHCSIEHVIPIANYGKTDDGWYMLGSIKINR